METRWRTVTMAGALVAAAALGASCAGPRMLNGGGPGRERVDIQYDAKQGVQRNRIRVRPPGGGRVDEYAVCVTPDTCRLGFPVDAAGKEVLGPNVTASDHVYILSDVVNPGRTCVCYGNRCYCN